jgi:hypothetical protein
MEIDKRCFKIDRPNAFAMINGFYKDGSLNRQSIWCEVRAKPFPMLITLNRTPTRFKVSELYKRQNLEEFSIPYRYIADLDSEYFIKNDMRLWQRVCGNGLFDIWDPIAPYSRFAECNSDPSSYRIQLLRIFEINEEFDDADIIPANSRIDHLTTTNRNVTKKQAVIPDEEFLRLRSLLKESVSEFMV